MPEANPTDQLRRAAAKALQPVHFLAPDMVYSCGRGVLDEPRERHTLTPAKVTCPACTAVLERPTPRSEVRA